MISSKTVHLVFTLQLRTDNNIVAKSPRKHFPRTRAHPTRWFEAHRQALSSAPRFGHYLRPSMRSKLSPRKLIHKANTNKKAGAHAREMEKQTRYRARRCEFSQACMRCGRRGRVLRSNICIHMRTDRCTCIFYTRTRAVIPMRDFHRRAARARWRAARNAGKRMCRGRITMPRAALHNARGCSARKMQRAREPLDQPGDNVVYTRLKSNYGRPRVLNSKEI